MFGWAIVRAGLPIQFAGIGMAFFGGILGIFATDFVLAVIEFFADIWAGLIGFILWFIPDFLLIDRVEQIDEQSAGRGDQPEWQHGLQVWTGFDQDEKRARELLANEMQQMYRIPFEKFEKYSPYGSPEVVAEFLAPYLEKGAQVFNIKPCAATEEAGIEAVAEVKRLLCV